ncbi:MAG: radical SAM protein [bacterium]
METHPYGKWSRGIHERMAPSRVPLSCSVEVTRRCPLSCRHCYNNLPLGDRKAARDEMNCEEHCRILDQLAEAGCLWLLYTGGEPFAREDFPDIYRYAKGKGMLITLFTNGILISERIADHLAAWLPFSIEITLYGRTREVHEQVTRVPGSYDRCMRGIMLLMERGLPLQLKTVALTINRHEIGDMKRFAQEDLGVEFKYDPMINPRIDCSRAPLAVRLSPAEVVALDLRDPQRATEWQEFAGRCSNPVGTPSTGHELYLCGGGVNSCAINPYGMLHLCVLSSAAGYDLRKGSLREGWERFLLDLRNTRASRSTKCLGCGLRAMCGMCPANGELECTDPESPVDFLCQVAHLRAYSLGIPVPAHGDCEYCPGGKGYETMMRTAESLKKGCY